jgi:hypothetical protein
MNKCIFFAGQNGDDGSDPIQSAESISRYLCGFAERLVLWRIETTDDEDLEATFRDPADCEKPQFLLSFGRWRCRGAPSYRVSIFVQTNEGGVSHRIVFGVSEDDRLEQYGYYTSNDVSDALARCSEEDVASHGAQMVMELTARVLKRVECANGQYELWDFLRKFPTP